MIPVILSGGVGSRLWPLSRAAFPKQFLRLQGDQSLFQAMLLLLSGDGFEDPIIVCNHEHRFVIAEQMEEVGIRPRAILLERAARNTAPAVAAALAYLGPQSSESVLIAPCDLAIGDPIAFRQSISRGAAAAGLGRITTFGVQPVRVETGFGYIERGAELEGAEGVYDIAAFREKPSDEEASGFVRSGRHYWNGGLFLAQAGRLNDAFHEHCPQAMVAASAAVSHAVTDFGFLQLDDKPFAGLAPIGLDHAVMEHTKRGAVVPIDCGWNDLGSWSAVAETGAARSDGNVVQGPATILDSERCFVRSEKPLVAMLGVRDIMVVATDDAVLVADRSRSQDVKEIVARLEKEKRNEHIVHTTVYRPWGNYQELDTGPGFKVKRITVKPGGMLSLQRHQHRSEHWVVVSGRATVTRGDEVLMLEANESTYIPAGTVHRLSNEEATRLEMIEVQTGSVLLEEDIERLSDGYGRQ